MTIAVDLGRKATKQTSKQTNIFSMENELCMCNISMEQEMCRLHNSTKNMIELHG